MSKFATSDDDNLPIATLVTHSSMRSVPAINAVPFTNSDHQELDQFLNTSGLGSFSSMLIEGGCDSLEAFADITEEDLADLNVTSMKRRQILRKASSIQSMNGATKVDASSPNFRSPRATTVETKTNSGGSPMRRASATFRTISDHYDSLDKLQKDLRKNGLESSDLIIGIDLTKSNTWQGEKT